MESDYIRAIHFFTDLRYFYSSHMDFQEPSLSPVVAESHVQYIFQAALIQATTRVPKETAHAIRHGLIVQSAASTCRLEFGTPEAR
jgi:hypothetical protein